MRSITQMNVCKNSIIIQSKMYLIKSGKKYYILYKNIPCSLIFDCNQTFRLRLNSFLNIKLLALPMNQSYLIIVITSDVNVKS